MAYLPILFRIQEIESKLQVIKRSQEQIRENAKLTALVSLQKQVQTSLTNLEQEMKKNSSLQRQWELEEKVNQEHLKHEEEKLYNGTVVTSRGLEQVQQKAAEYKKNIEKLEDQLLNLLEQAEKLTLQQVDLQQRLKVCNEEIAGIEQEIQQKLAEIAFEECELKQEVEETYKQVPSDWLERYQRIAKAHFGVGIAKIKVNSCGACHVDLSESLLRNAKQGEDALYFCENCGRILYY